MTNFFQSFFIWAIIDVKNISFAATMTKQKTLYLHQKLNTTHAFHVISVKE